MNSDDVSSTEESPSIPVSKITDLSPRHYSSLIPQDKEYISQLRHRIESLRATNVELKSHLKTKTSEAQRLQLENHTLLNELEGTMGRIRELRHRDRQSLLDKDEDIVRLQERIVEVEEQNRGLSEQVSKLTGTLRDTIKEKDSWVLQDKSDEGRKDKLLHAKEAVLESNAKRIASLQHQLTSLKQQFDTIRNESIDLRRALMERNDEICLLQSKLSTQAIASAEHGEEAEGKKQETQDLVLALQANVRRLLTLLCHPPPSPTLGWGQYLVRAGITDEFVFLGSSGGEQQVQTTAAALLPYEPLGKALEELHTAVEVFGKTKNAMKASSTSSSCGGVKKSMSDVPVVPVRERDYWIPQEVFAIVSKFKHQHFPEQPVEMFYNVLIEMNQVWRKRLTAKLEQHQQQQHRKQQQQQTQQQKPPGRPSVTNRSDIEKLLHVTHPTPKLWEHAVQTIKLLLQERREDQSVTAPPVSSSSSVGALNYLIRRTTDITESYAQQIQSLCHDCVHCLTTAQQQQQPSSTTMPFALINMQKEFIIAIQKTIGECRRAALDAVTRAQCMHV